MQPIIPLDVRRLFFAYFPLQNRLVCKAWAQVFDNDPRVQTYRNLRNAKFSQAMIRFSPREEAWSHMQFFPCSDRMAVEVIVFEQLSTWHKFFDFSHTETGKSCLTDPQETPKKYFNPLSPTEVYNYSENVKTCAYRGTLYKGTPTGIQLFKCVKVDEVNGFPIVPYYKEGEKLPQELKCPDLCDFIVLPNFLIVSARGIIKVYDLVTFKHLYDINDKHYTYLGAARQGARIHAHSTKGWVLLDFGVTPLPKSHGYNIGPGYKRDIYAR